jgi:hypothetical protein
VGQQQGCKYQQCNSSGNRIVPDLRTVGTVAQTRSYSSGKATSKTNRAESRAKRGAIKSIMLNYIAKATNRGNSRGAKLLGRQTGRKP